VRRDRTIFGGGAQGRAAGGGWIAPEARAGPAPVNDREATTITELQLLVVFNRQIVAIGVFLLTPDGPLETKADSL
jgi:hypothetical protein